MRIKLFIYNFVIIGLLPIIGCFLIPVFLFSTKRRQTFRYRLGVLGIFSDLDQNRFKTRPIWVHALSVGEVAAADPLIDELRTVFGRCEIMFSVSTQTGYQLACRNLGRCVDQIIYFPYDIPVLIGKAVAQINPAAVIIVETDIWPNFLNALSTRHIPVLLVNARISDKACKRYRLFSFMTRSLFRLFTFVCVQSTNDIDRFVELGVPFQKIKVTGGLKYDISVRHLTRPAIDDLKRRYALPLSTKIVLAGSTHSGEEKIILAAWRRVIRIIPNVFLIIAPRDPERASKIENLCKTSGFEAIQLSELESGIDMKHSDVLIIDRIGELKTLYLLADIAFIGGSLSADGGHNPLEAAVFSKPILFGPDMSDFAMIAQELTANEGACVVEDADDLFDRLVALMTDMDHLTRMGKRAYRTLQTNRGAVAKTVDIVKRYFI